jgi:hypothetical protein
LFYVVILNVVKNPRISSFDSICPLNHFVCFTNANVNLFFPKTLSKSPCQARKPLISLIANDIELAKYPKQARIINVEGIYNVKESEGRSFNRAIKISRFCLKARVHPCRKRRACKTALAAEVRPLDRRSIDFSNNCQLTQLESNI